MQKCLGSTFVILTAACGLSSTQAAIIAPYTADGAALHLYHFDDASAPLVDSGYLANRPLGTVTSTLGATALPGFGTAISQPTGTSSTIQSKESQDSPQSDWQGANGSFTYEAFINPAAAASVQMTIMSRDHTTGGPNRRSFIFRINAGNLDFINTGQSSNQTLSFALPTTGANAYAIGSWYNIAVSYTGAEGTAGNFSAYFTKIPASGTATTANLLGTGQLNFDVGEVAGAGALNGDTPFTIGNRDSSNSGFQGLIDEVRISSVARDPATLVGVPEPTSLAALALAGVALQRRRRA